MEDVARFGSHRCPCVCAMNEQKIITFFVTSLFTYSQNFSNNSKISRSHWKLSKISLKFQAENATKKLQSKKCQI